MSHLTPSPSYPNRPIPKRLLSLQPTPKNHFDPSTPPKTTASTYTYPSPQSPYPSSRPKTSLPPSRPGAPKRSHSFCGDPSTSNYALASANSCAHLSADKSMLVAPPLERTLSSTGYTGNRISSEQPMVRRHTRDHIGRQPLTPPISPLRANTPLPKILISNSSPTRPGLNPLQRRSTTGTANTRPRIPRREESLGSYTSSRAPSFVIETPAADHLPIITFTGPVSTQKAKAYNERGLEGCGEDDDDVMLVDDMVESIEDLVV